MRIWILLSLLYIAPVCRILFFFLQDDCRGVRRLSRWTGCLELWFGWARDFAVIGFTLWTFGWRIHGWAEGGAFSWPFEIIFLGLAVYNRWWRWHGLKPMQEFARLNPKAEPQEFFDHLYRRLGFLPHRVPSKAGRLFDPTRLDYRTGKPVRQSVWLCLRGTYVTYLLGGLVYKAFRWKGAHYIKGVGPGLSMIWVARLVQLARMEVVVERSPELEKARDGKIIYALSHKSLLDIALAQLAYFREKPDGSAAPFMPRVMIAKDHFRDNFFLYRIVGMGQMLEAWGMIFVDRKSKDRDKGKRAVAEAVKRFLPGDMPIALYPQGTRARGQLDRYGSRWDAGYFCVGKRGRLKKEGGHFKKGIGYIASATAQALAKYKAPERVWILPVGMIGPGTACPKGSWKIQTETKVTIKMGAPIPVDENMTADGVIQKVDGSLRDLLGVATRLERRFFTDLRGILDQRGMDEAAVAVKQWRQEEIIYLILDCIYALPMGYWRGFLTELSNLLRHDCTREELHALRDKLADLF